jgi:hypothetical protein
MATGQSLNQVCTAKLQGNGSPLAGIGTGSAAADFSFPGLLEAAVKRWGKQLIGVILFGSAARGDATENSDIDLMLVMDPEMKITRALYLQWEHFCREHCRTRESARISPHFVSLAGSVHQAGGLWYETAIEGIVLWESGCRVSRFLASVRTAMGHGKIRRRMAQGSPYWIKEF